METSGEGDTPVQVVKVAEKFGPVCVDPDAGTDLCDVLAAALASGEHVQVDFEGVSSLATLFLNSAIGCLYGKFPHEYVDAKLEPVGLDDLDLEFMRVVRDNAIRFYSSSDSQKAQLADHSDHLAYCH
ncbi:STAS-like domain-containing protein [Singulisphaera rosea]